MASLISQKDIYASRAGYTPGNIQGAAQDLLNARLAEVSAVIYKALMVHIDPNMAINMPPNELQQEAEDFVGEFISSNRLQVNRREQRQIAVNILNDMIGLGPLEALLQDEQITDIMVNSHNVVYVERKGKLEKSWVQFRDPPHVLQVAQRIANRIGRRVDESSPMVDARLPDGSRVNIIIPPVSLNGTVISIRKFSKVAIDIASMIKQQNLSQEIAKFLQLAMTCRLNVLVSGGTGSGKTTLLNAISQLITSTDRIVTIEDAAELRLQQPHVVRLETRPPNIEGEGSVSIRDLVRNALRMRPDRIIVGEVRGQETVDMLQAMNTGHDGSMSTIHANRAIEALLRLENMISMSDVSLPTKALRAQIAGGVDLIIQVERMRDGVRRINEIVEVMHAEDETIHTQKLFSFHYSGEDNEGHLLGQFTAHKATPAFLEKASFYGLDSELKTMFG